MLWYSTPVHITRWLCCIPRFNRQLSNSSFSVACTIRLESHIRTSSIYTVFLTRLKTHLFAESLLWHCYAVVFSLYFWRPRALDVGRHSKFMLIDWLIDLLIYLFVYLFIDSSSPIQLPTLQKGYSFWWMQLHFTFFYLSHSYSI